MLMTLTGNILQKFGGLADLSVAELNMYLTERCGMSAEDVRKTGFDKKRKTKLIKENIMCGHPQNASISMKMIIQSNDNSSGGSKPLPAVPP